jgi:S1-C subfamily serine protease
VRSGVRPSAPSTAEGPARAGLQVAERAGHVVIAGVQPYSAAARAGVRPGQTIVSANGTPVSSVSQLVNIVRSADGVISLIVNDPDAGRVIINYELSA